MEILHVHNIANVARTLADEQTKMGHLARVMARKEPRFETPEILLPAATNPLRAQLAILRHHREMRAADVLHIHSDVRTTELVWPFLRRVFRGKVFVLHLYGSETPTKRELADFVMADRVFCSTPDLLPLVPGSEWLPYPVRVPARPSGVPPGKPVIGHFVTRGGLGGTQVILDAFRGLGKSVESISEPGVVRLENDAAVLLVISNQTHAQALATMDRCALVIDQLTDVGAYSPIAAEAMARGKSVVGSYDPALYPVPPPILRLTPGRLRHVLRGWLDTPETWAVRGREGRAFIEAVHAADRVASKTLLEYYRAANRWRPRGGDLKCYWRARGARYRNELVPGTERGANAAVQEEALLDLLRGLDIHVYAEVGCGFGRVLKRVAEALSPAMVGLDLSIDQLREAREYAPSAASCLIAGDLEHLPLRAQSVDLVLASEVLMHLDPEQVVMAIREMARVTRRYVVSVDWYENFMMAEQVRHCFVHDYAALYAREGFSVRRIPLRASVLQSVFLAERS
jgi:SAM-dependent methyltransferase